MMIPANFLYGRVSIASNVPQSHNDEGSYMHKRLEAYLKLCILRVIFKAHTCIQAVVVIPRSHLFVG